MVKAKVRKELYWHKLAKVLLEHGLMPKHCAEAIKRVYPEADVTGRHIGAYKRRLTTEGVITTILPNSVVSLNEMISMVADYATEEDMFVYNCSIGSQIQALKCFEYKLTAETEDDLVKVEQWIQKIKK